MEMKIEYQNRTGLFPEHRGVTLIPQTYQRVRLTIPVYEALERAGATVTPEPDDARTGARLCSVTLSPVERVPDGMVTTRIIGTSHLGLRLAIEPEYPGEIAEAYWEQLDFTGCPQCGRPLIWYEAGYVPGYRVCARPPHHHVLARRKI
jgi:hypothetical protein